MGKSTRRQRRDARALVLRFCRRFSRGLSGGLFDVLNGALESYERGIVHPQIAGNHLVISGSAVNSYKAERRQASSTAASAVLLVTSVRHSIGRPSVSS
jgi:hypothetical protein